LSKVAGYLSLISNLYFGNQASKRKARYAIASALTKKWGFRLYQYDNTWHQDPDFLQILEKFPGGGYTPKRYNLFFLAKGVAHLAGDTVECGVATGITSFLICHATSMEGRYHYAFDSFEGLPEPSKNDIAPNMTTQLRKGEFAVDINRVKENLKDFDNVHLYQGWIPDRFNEVVEKSFIFVHIDLDFYQPTLDSLNFFYERTVPGGIVLCDDYGFIGTPGAKKAMNEFFLHKPEPILKLDAGHALIIKT